MEDKLALLDQVLKSPALGRSDQLRQMLRFLVTEEAEGRGAQLTEFTVGVRALSRPPNYSPETDSTVRTRAHELRRRLDEYYRQAEPGSWRIELPKGTYQPRFVRIPARETVTVASAVPFAHRRSWWLPFLGGFAAAAACALALWSAARSGWFLSRSEAAARAVWGSALEPGSTVKIALGTPLHFWIRDLHPEALPKNGPPFLLPMPLTPEAEDWYRRYRSGISGKLYLHPNVNSPLWGEAAGAVALAEFFAARGVHAELLAEYTIRAAALKEHNAVLLGRGEHNRAAQALTPAGALSIRFVPEIGEFAIVDPGGKVMFQRTGGGGTNYGLATVLSRNTAAGVRRTVLFSGISSDGTQAAVEYLSAPARLEELVGALRKPGGKLPESFQVVVRSTSRDSLTLAAERVALHRIEAR